MPSSYNNGMLRHANFSMRVNFKLQPFITVFAVFLFTCLEKACLLLARANQGTAKGLAFSRRVNNKTAKAVIKRRVWNYNSLVCYIFFE